MQTTDVELSALNQDSNCLTAIKDGPEAEVNLFTQKYKLQEFV